MITAGQVVKIKGQKRVVAKVENVISEPYQYRVTLAPRYRPAPRSRLKTRSIFSIAKKNKPIIIK